MRYLRKMQALDLRLLEIFRAVALEGSVSRAAERLNRVQSNISTRVRQLEEMLGKRLFQRHRTGLALTEDGRLLLTYADRLIELSIEASDALRADKPSGTFRIGTMESTAAARLPAILSRFHALYPDVQVELETDTAGGLIERLAALDVEAAFIAEPVEFDSLKTVPVFEEKLVLVVPASFPPLGRRGEISGKTIVAFEEGCAYRRYLQAWLHEEDITPGTIISVGSYLAILACVSAGTGYAVVPESVLKMIASKGDYRRYPLPPKFQRIRTMLTWRSNYQSTKLDALRALLPKPAAAR